MNERIKQLAEQAGFYFYDMHDVDGQDLGESVEADSWSAAEKFADMIVKECIDIMQNCEGDLDFAIFKTKRHFGEKCEE